MEWIPIKKKEAIALKVFFDQSRQGYMSAHTFFWKYTCTSLSQDAFSTAHNLFPFPWNIIRSFGCSPVGQKQTFKVQKHLLSPVFGCEVRTSLFRFSFDLLSICLYVLVVSLAKGRGDCPHWNVVEADIFPTFYHNLVHQHLSKWLFLTVLNAISPCHFSSTLLASFCYGEFFAASNCFS